MDGWITKRCRSRGLGSCKNQNRKVEDSSQSPNRKARHPNQEMNPHRGRAVSRAPPSPHQLELEPLTTNPKAWARIEPLIARAALASTVGLTSQLVPQLDRPGLPTQILVEHLSAVVRHYTEEHALARFHPIRPISDSMAGESVVFLLQVGLCSESGSQLGQHLKTLCMNSSLQLCGCTLRPDRTQRSNLANQISKSLG